jgi:eukaryotic-like serine/threonine-protein kinase
MGAARPAIHALLADQRNRWRAGDRVTVEQFVAAHPSLADHPDALLDLIYAEVLLRRAAGEHPVPAEYTARFPAVAAEVRDQFEVDAALPERPTMGPASTGPYVPVSGPSVPPGYELLEEVGRGGMGVVYKARHQRLDRIVALKMVRSGELADPLERARFASEARAVARLSHPNIVQIYEVGEANGCPFLALEFVPGGTLADALAGPLPLRPSAALVATVARAVHHAHQAGIVHRDLKPANVLLGDDELGRVRNDGTTVTDSPSFANLPSSSFRPKITDFGLAKLLEVADGPTRTGDFLGTPNYAAPEQAFAAEVVGPPADVHALGAILYHLLTGRPPFAGATALETLDQVRFADPVPPSRLRPNLPRDLETITLKCLRKDPAKRYPTAAALADDLDRFLAGQPIAARPVGPVERGLKWCRRRPAAAALAGVSGLAGAGLLAVLVVSDVRVRHRQAETAAALRAETDARRDLAETLERERYTLYLQRIRLAQAAVLASNVRQADRDLEACRPGPGDRDFRAWEWSYLKGLCHAEMLAFRRHARPVSWVAFHPAGDRLASIGRDLNLMVWDAAGGNVRYTRPVPTADARGCFSPDGKWLAIGDPGRNRVVVHAAADGREVYGVAGTAPVFSPDGGRLAAVDVSRKQIRIYAAGDGAELKTLPYQDHLADSFAFRPDGLWAAAAGPDRTIRVWNVEAGGAGYTLPGQPTGAFRPVFSPDGRRVASAGEDGTVRLWDAATGADLGTVPAHPTGNITCLTFSPDGRRFASGDLAGAVRVWDADGRSVQALPGHGAGVLALAFGPGGRALASASVDQTVKVWDAETDPKAVAFRGHVGFVLGVGFAPDGGRLASAGFDGRVKVWEAATGRVLLDLPGRMGRIAAVRFSPDGGRLAAVSQDTAVRVWDAATGREVSRFEGRNGSRVATVSPCGTYVAAAADGSGVKLWELATGRPLRTLTGHLDRVQGLDFSPDGGRIAAAGRDGTVRVWEASTGGELYVLRGHTDPVRCVAFSPDGRLLATGGGDDIRLWDPRTGGAVRTLRGRWGRSTVHALGFSPDGRRLAAGGVHAAVTLWDTDSGEEVVDLPTPRMIVTGVRFGPDGRSLAAVTNDGTVTVWTARPAVGDDSFAK